MRVYTIPFALTAVDAAADIVEVIAGEGKKCALLGFHLGKCGSVSERLRLTIIRRTAGFTSGSSPSTGGGSVTPAPADPADSAFAGTAEAGNETRASTGTATTLVEDAFDPSAGYDFVPPDPEERPMFEDGQGLLIGIESAPNASNVAFNGYAVVAEL